MSKQTIKQVVVTLVSDDSEDYPEIQVAYNGKPTKCFRLSPYGLFSNPVNGSLGIAYSSQGQEAVKYVIPVSTIDRMKDIKEGECGLYNELTGAFVLMNSSGGIDILATDTIEITAPEVVINGNFTLTGNFASTGTMTNNSVNVGSTHEHPQGNDSANDVQQDTGGPQ